MAVERVAAHDRASFLLRADHRLLRVGALAGLLVLWEALTRVGWIPALFLPSPLGVIRELGEMAASGQLFVHLDASLRRLCSASLSAPWRAWRWASSRDSSRARRR